MGHVEGENRPGCPADVQLGLQPIARAVAQLSLNRALLPSPQILCNPSTYLSPDSLPTCPGTSGNLALCPPGSE